MITQNEWSLRCDFILFVGCVLHSLLQSNCMINDGQGVGSKADLNWWIISDSVTHKRVIHSKWNWNTPLYLTPMGKTTWHAKKFLLLFHFKKLKKKKKKLWWLIKNSLITILKILFHFFVEKKSQNIASFSNLRIWVLDWWSDKTRREDITLGSGKTGQRLQPKLFCILKYVFKISKSWL